MTETMEQQEVRTLSVRLETDIKAPAKAVFDAVLAEMGPESEMPDGTPFPMVIEPWAGGRWYRDLGDTHAKGAGHWWGTVQVIKPPTLLEISGPLFMSYPATSHVQYRLTESGPSATKLTITHRAMGLITDEHREGVQTGWRYGLEKIRAIAEKIT